MSEEKVEVKTVHPHDRGIRKWTRTTLAICLIRVLAAACWHNASRVPEQVDFGAEHKIVPLRSLDVATHRTGDLKRSPETRAFGPKFKAGDVATIGKNGIVSFVNEDNAGLQKRVAWADPLRRLDGMTLKDAVQLFNRYNVIKLEVSGRGLEDTRLSGSFHLAEPEEFAESLQRLGICHVVQVSISNTNPRILMLRK
jgi:hypothetical protein